MKRALLFLIAACAGGYLMYQAFLAAGEPVGTEPGLDPGPRTAPLEVTSPELGRRDADVADRGGKLIRAKLSGVVRDHLGSPRAGERIWILRPGERHPKVLGHAHALATVESDQSGKFEVEIGPEDEWHFSLGAIGGCVLTTEVRRFQSGESAEVDIVIGNGAHLRVEVTPSASVQTNVQPARIEVQRKTQAGDDDMIPFGAPPVPGFGLDPNAKPEPPEPWATSAALALRVGEPIVFPKLRVGDTYRLAIVLGTQTVVSETNIVLKGGEDRLARCELGEAQGQLTLKVRLESVPVRGALVPGFHWKP